MSNSGPGPAETTVTVTSFYVPDPTVTATPAGSTSSSKRFVAIATGAAIGGFAFTCLLGWFLFRVWRRRHPGEWARARPDAENFPGWRRTGAPTKLKETRNSEAKDSSYETATAESTLGSRLQLPPSLLHNDDRPGYSRQTSSTAPLLPLPSAPDLLQEVAALLPLINAGVTPKVGDAENTSVPAQAASRPPSTPLTPGGMVAYTTPLPESPTNDMASHASSVSSFYRPPSSSGHVASASMSGHRRQTPSPTQHRRSNSIGSHTNFLPSSWHGHSGTRGNHSSWQGPLPTQYQRPPSSWNGHHSVLMTSADLQRITPSRPLRPQSPPSPSQPKFYFQSPSTPSIPKLSPPPSPELEPPRKLTVTNPDLNGSTSSVANSETETRNSPTAP